MRKVRAAEIILDFDLYPRNNVNPKNISNIVDALSAGVEMPPGIIDKKSKRAIDCFHRVKAVLRLYGPDAEIMVIEKSYKNEAEMFLDAMRYNASHGLPMDPCDRTRCTIIAERLSIPLEAVAGALHMPADKLGALRSDRTATAGGITIPLKRTICQQFHGRKLNKRQVEANTKLSGMNQQFYANQLIELLESKMLDTDDEHLMQRLRVLNGLLDEILAVV